MQAVRRQILRRVRYATNTLALLETRLPPEGPFDTALTNGLLVIVATEWPGEEFDPRKPGFLVSARALLKIIQDKPVHQFSFVAFDVLRDGLNLTQPFRHGQAHDEFATITGRHYTALTELDQYPGLRFLEQARGLSVDEAVLRAYRDHVEQFRAFDLKDRLEEPEPDECPECWRPTFLAVSWDDFGGTNGPGECVACGYERTARESYDLASAEDLQRLMEKD
jgi:hypothetical protein